MPTDLKEAASAHDARDRAIAWLNDAQPTEATQAMALRLLLDRRAGHSAQTLKPRIDLLLGLQNSDGGWSQLKDLPSDAYATGQVLWVLSFLGITLDHPHVGRAIAFLVSNQQESGSWPMTPRSLPETDPSKPRYTVPIIHFGSAWATLGLVRFVPATLDAASNQQRAFDSIRGFSGTYEVDQNAPGQPVVSVTVKYEIDDDQLVKLVRLLTSFPELKSLRFSSPNITDAGATHLKVLSQLHQLSLEQAAITDAGLVSLKALAGLEELNLKGTNVSDSGAEGFQRALPNAKLQR